MCGTQRQDKTQSQGLVQVPTGLITLLAPLGGLTDGLEALERVRDTDEVLSIFQTAVGVGIPGCFACWREVRGAVDQPEALMFVQQNNT